MSDWQLASYVLELNNRPRKCLDYRMPVARSKEGGADTPDFGRLALLLETGKMGELEELDLSVKAVRPGDPLLVRIPPRGTPGRDVFGREISLDSLEAALPQAGHCGDPPSVIDRASSSNRRSHEVQMYS